MILRERHDEYQGPAAQTVSLRALALPLRELTRLLEPGGRLVVFGANPSPEAPWESLWSQPQPGRPGSGATPRGPVGGACGLNRHRGVPRETPDRRRPVLSCALLGDPSGTHHSCRKPEGRRGKDHDRHQPRREPRRGRAAGARRGRRPPGEPHLGAGAQSPRSPPQPLRGPHRTATHGGGAR